MLTERKLKGALVGFGFISSHGHMPAYEERHLQEKDVEILAVCDVCPAREAYIPKDLKFYINYRELIANEKNNLDFVDISTHAADHFQIAKLALENGLHVLCEKPLTTTTKEAYELLQLAFDSKLVLFPCHNYKHAPVINAIRELIQSNKIGKVNAVTLNTFRNTHAIGTKEWKPNWRRFKKYSGGGIAMDHGSHSLYLAFEWLGGYPKSVTASSFNLSKEKFDTEDNFSAVYEFENGVANIHLSWTAGVRKVLYTIQGDNGAITVDDDQLQLATWKIDELDKKIKWNIENYNISSSWFDASHTTWFNKMFSSFKHAIVNNDFQNNEIVDAYFCISSITKAYESIENNSNKIILDKTFPLNF
ncbi:MAG: Gfo/Idh/MocA family oxidoreductase [Bacteriovorax sp.]|nr:Gfo/Idh/MocA family oxidoreductase [Bacteriovorax sp.]